MCSVGYDPVGWGLPYGNLVSTDTAKELMETSIQLLIILLDYGYPIQPKNIHNNNNNNNNNENESSHGGMYVGLS